MATKDFVTNAGDVGYGKPPKSTRFPKGKSGNPRGRPPAAKSMATLLKEAFEEKVTTKVNGRVRSITKKEMALRRLVHGAAKGEPKPFNLLLKYDPVLPDIESESRSNAKPFLGLKYIVIPDNRREPDVTERLLKVRAEARAKYYSRMRKD